MKKIVIIMAGGKGKRLWPISKENLPKQFLKLTGEKTMLEYTIERASKIVQSEDIYIVTQPKYKNVAEKQLGDVPKENILSDVNLNSTTEAIAYASAIIEKKLKNAVTIVFPSDHMIKNDDLFNECICKAVRFAKDNHIVTLGILPKYPETNYGYIKKDKMIGRGVYKVEKFKEKPDLKLAEKYYKSKKYLWNSGIFIWKNSTIKNEIEKYLPDLHKKAEEISSIDTKKLKNIFNNIKTNSIDYDILEKSNNIYVVESKFRWADIGNLKTLKNQKEKDTESNSIEGKCIIHNSKNNMIISKEKTIIALGVENLIIVEGENEFLVMDTSKETESPNKVIERYLSSNND